MIASLYAAAASLVSRTEDLGSTSMPIMMLIFLPYMAVILFSSNETVMAVMSYIPFSAAVAVPMRVFLGTIEWWEPLVSLLILVSHHDFGSAAGDPDLRTLDPAVGSEGVVGAGAERSKG